MALITRRKGVFRDKTKTGVQGPLGTIPSNLVVACEHAGRQTNERRGEPIVRSLFAYTISDGTQNT